LKLIDKMPAEDTRPAKKQKTWTEMDTLKGHPADTLRAIAAEKKLDVFSTEFAAHMDAVDPLQEFRDEFVIPTCHPHTGKNPLPSICAVTRWVACPKTHGR
jgi:hypothetical protein